MLSFNLKNLYRYYLLLLTLISAMATYLLFSLILLDFDLVDHPEMRKEFLIVGRGGLAICFISHLLAFGFFFTKKYHYALIPLFGFVAAFLLIFPYFQLVAPCTYRMVSTIDSVRYFFLIAGNIILISFMSYAALLGIMIRNYFSKRRNLS